ncbi:MAG: ParA family protein [Rhodospirillaceae bacterium]|nr:ParA family protein [Rhodospirillaceae bacterium]
MAGTVITVAQQKGGAGKTTLVAHLAIAFRQGGKSVATVDIDPQASLTRWVEARRAMRGDGIDITHSQITGWRTASEVERLARSHDIVVIDSPPHAETEARLAVRAANLAIVPVQPSPMDFWATTPTLEMAKQERVPALIVLNRVPPRAKLAEAVIAKMAELGVEVAETHVGNRVGFAAALLEGQSVTETEKGTRAAKEIRALATEVLQRAGSRR